MRSKKPDLEDVKAQFASWRRERRGKSIPENLWRAALRLLERYSSSTICAALGLNATRFKQVREGGSWKAKRSPGRVRRGRAQRRALRLVRGRSPAQVLPIPSGGPAFIELPSVGVGSSGLLARASSEVERAGARCCLTLESALGRISVITLRGPEEGLVEAVCRWALGAPTDSSRS